jgi:hypothetical protein
MAALPSRTVRPRSSAYSTSEPAAPGARAVVRRRGLADRLEVGALVAFVTNAFGQDVDTLNQRAYLKRCLPVGQCLRLDGQRHLAVRQHHRGLGAVPKGYGTEGCGLQVFIT